MNDFDGKTMNLINERMKQLQQLFPEVFIDGKIDFDKFRLVLGDYIENENERYEFTWKGKTKAIQLSQKQITATLRPDRRSSKNWDRTKNLYIEGDNLEVLRTLQQAYRNKVRLIYIDPPYNTGGDFIYQDNFTDNIANYKERMDESYKSNAETSGRYHTDWLNMMYPRLKLARNLLMDEGVICVSIDDNEYKNLQAMMDEIYGENNRFGVFVWEKTFAPRNDAKTVSYRHEYVLVYAKDIDKTERNLLPMTEEQKARYKNPDNDPRGPWQSDNLSVGRYTPKDMYEIETPSKRKVLPPSGSSWRFSKDKMEELIADNRIWFGEDGNNTPRLKRFLSEVQQGKVPETILFHKDVGHTQSATRELIKLFGKKLFDYPKPIQLIKTFLLLFTKKDRGDIVLDFFSGSATTAHATIKLNEEDGGNRRFIMVQLPEKVKEKSEAFKDGYKTICDIGKERIRLVGEKVEHEVDTGFRVFQLDTTNLKKWDGEEKELESTLFDYINAVKQNRTEEDVVFEILLKYGIDLSTSVEKLMIEDKIVYSIDKAYVLICLERNLDLAFIEQLLQFSNCKRMVFYDEGFKDDTIRINAQQLFKQYGVEDVRVL